MRDIFSGGEKNRLTAPDKRQLERTSRVRIPHLYEEES